MTDLVIAVPMLGRAHRVQPLLASIRDTAPTAHVVFALTPRDHAVIEAVKSSGEEWIEVPRRPRGDYARKINTVLARTDEPLIFTGADDLCFYPDWFGLAKRQLRTAGIGVVGTNDLGNPRVLRGEHATHCLVTREYAARGLIDGRPGLLCEDYPHEYVDDELVGTAKHRRAWAFARGSIVEHLHPHWHKAPLDKLYEQQSLRMRQGVKIYRDRQKLWQGREST